MAKKLQLLRNNSVYGTHAAALQILNSMNLENRADGEVLIARYTDEEGKIKSILGIVAKLEEGNSLTIIDLANIESEIGGNVTEINNTINTLVEGAGLNEDGTYTPKSDANYIKTATTLYEADVKLDEAIKLVQEAIGTGGSVDTQIGTQIELALKALAYDSTLNTDGGDYVASIKQEDGVISTTMGKLVVKDIKSGDKFLAASNGELSSTISVNYDSNKKEIQLLGINNEIVSTIDATAFIKDGMVESVSYDADSAKLTMSFNTDAGKEAVEIDLSGLINTYTAGNGLSLNGGEFSVNIAENDLISINENKEIVVSDTWDCGSYDE